MGSCYPGLQIVRIVKTGPGQFVFVTKGNAVGPEELLVRRANGKVEREPQRFVMNPDVYVEVRDGKIFAVRADLQHH